ncbi:hypothetical protein TIFTF001_046015 [Ficus carica]|uniref:Uncharacterized protein n=1 Tax=Ficus carica TaxID=3494 RepID=A0AA88CPM5_FICCA|nr:hypothetical protein TIFTF001_046015 [Ficus carica]
MGDNLLRCPDLNQPIIGHSKQGKQPTGEFLYKMVELGGATVKQGISRYVFC